MLEKERLEVSIRNWRGWEFKQSEEVRDMAEVKGLHRNKMNKLEVGRYEGDMDKLKKIEKVMVAEGVEFIEEKGGGPGVRLRKRQRLKKPK